MNIKHILAALLLSITTMLCSAQSTNEAYMNKAREYEAIARVYIESAEIANAAVMSLEGINLDASIKKRSNLDEAVKAEKIANLQKQMYLDHLEVFANYLTVANYYGKAGSKELVENAEKEVRKYYNLALHELYASGEAYALAAERYEKEKQAEKAIEFKRKQADILKILARESQIPK